MSPGGGKVLGIIPSALKEREAHDPVVYGEQVAVDSMHDRKFKMYQASDAFVALAGGFGTLDELLEVVYVALSLLAEFHIHNHT
jgi:predicted Rossmann-fold nucleotide-binding protein